MQGKRTALEKWNMERVAKWNLNQNKICTMNANEE